MRVSVVLVDEGRRVLQRVVVRLAHDLVPNSGSFKIPRSCNFMRIEATGALVARLDAISSARNSLRAEDSSEDPCRDFI